MPSQEILDDPDFKATGKFVTKQLVSIELCLHVQEYTAEIYRNSKKGERVHGAFPTGVVDDVNYDGSIKAFLYLLNNDCNVSIKKCQNFLSELTGGKLVITWSTKMHSLIQEIIHYRNSREPGIVIEEAVIKRIEEGYTDILKIAKDEYEYEPPPSTTWMDIISIKEWKNICQIIFCFYTIQTFRLPIMKQNVY